MAPPETLVALLVVVVIFQSDAIRRYDDHPLRAAGVSALLGVFLTTLLHYAEALAVGVVATAIAAVLVPRDGDAESGDDRP